MTRFALFIGRILAALGAVLIVAALIVTAVGIATADQCSEPDCDEARFKDATWGAVVAVPIAVFVGAAGVALVNDTYKKLE